jgi:hypothetical protein
MSGVSHGPSLRSIAGIYVRDTCSCSFEILDDVFTDTSTKIDFPLRCSSPACFSAPASVMSYRRIS